MRVNELIDILRDQPAEAEVELAVVAPVEDDADDITVDRYVIDGVLPWIDADDEPSLDDDGIDEGKPASADGAITVWLVGGVDADVDAFLDAIEQTVDDTERTGDRPP
jgi:hypothetical protein